jgi:hypothetical protein
VDNDGFSDWTVWQSPRFYLFHGAPGGAPRDTVPIGGLDTDLVVGIGDVDGDGTGDLAEALGGDWPEINIWVGSEGRFDRLPRQKQLGGQFIDWLGASDDPDQFMLAARGRSAGGRGRVRLEWQVAPLGTPLDGTAIHSGPWAAMAAPAADGSYGTPEGVASFSGEGMHHWRLRTKPRSPFFGPTEWFTLSRTVASVGHVRPGADGNSVVAGGPFAEAGLHLAGPNPFRTGTALRFTLPAERNVRLTIVDVTGRRVKDLAFGPRAAGPHVASWDGRDATGRPAAAGVYFAKLSAEDGQSVARKLVLLR